MEQLLICGAVARDRWRVETKKAEKKGSQSARSKQLGYAASLGKVSQPTRTEKLAYAAAPRVCAVVSVFVLIIDVHPSASGQAPVLGRALAL